MTQCDKTVTLTELPTCDDVPRDSYLIVQGESTTCKVKVSDLILGSENIDFYPELTEILNRLDLLTSIVEANSSQWSEAYTHTLSGHPLWESVADVNLQEVKNTLDNNKDNWSDAYTTIASNSGSWEASSNTVEINSDAWTLTHDIVAASKADWDTAYAAATDGFQAISEAMEMIEVSPWFTLYTGSSAQSVYSTVNANSGSW